MTTDTSDWQVAGRRKRAPRKQTKHPSIDADVGNSCDQLRRITDAMHELRAEDFWCDWKALLLRQLCSKFDGGDTTACLRGSPQDCVCYGLGSFSSCVSARYQLALLLLLLEALQIPVAQCCVYDPVFSTTEKETLGTLGFVVLTENEEGKRAVCKRTVFYLMHCGKALYNNLLWKNWKPHTLTKLLIIGNSFHGIQERMLQRELERDYAYLSAAMNMCEETPMPCSPRFSDVFNDTSLIQFPAEQPSELPQSTWDDSQEPHYQHCQDLEIIRRDES